jgi:uncharacterized protein involved in exopolysaccharide biosynthesis
MTNIAPNESKQHGFTDEINIGEFFRALRPHARYIVEVAIASALWALLIALLLPPIYRAEVLLAPTTDEDSRSSWSGVASQFGGLASLAGVRLGESSAKAEAVATLKSRVLIDTYVAETDLLPVLFRSSWDSKRKVWKTYRHTPTLWDAYQLFSDKIEQVTEERKSGLVTISISWDDPVLAARWANDLVRRTNLYLRDRSIEWSNRNIDYLNDQLKKTSVVQVQQAIYRLLEAEIKKVMIAQGSEEYAFKIVDAAVPPERRSWPKRGLATIFGFVVGLIGACLYVPFKKGAVP